MRQSLSIGLTTVVLVLVLCNGLAAAESDPNINRGFNANQVYQIGDVDSVNVSNGNVILRIPIGPRFTVGPTLSYQLTLVYNGKIWDYLSTTDPQLPSYPIPEHESNAGLGWMLSLGRLRCPPASQVANAGTYIAPDGSTYEFLGDPDAAVAYAAGGTYLRMRRILDGASRRIDFPDGTVHTFDCPSGDLTRIEDPHGNWVKVDVQAEPDDPTDPDDPRKIIRWVITDGYGIGPEVSRVHTVNFQRIIERSSGSILQLNPNLASRVDSVVLFSNGGPTATYDLEYHDEGPVHSDHYDETALTRVGRGEGYGRPTPCVTVPLLRSVELPDGAKFEATYNGVAEATEVRCAQVSPGNDPLAFESGVIRSLKLPSGGSIEWGTGPYVMNMPSCGADPEGNLGFEHHYIGITSRTMKDTSGAVLAQWTYEPRLPPSGVPHSSLSCGGTEPTLIPTPGQVFINVVKSPNGAVTKHYFSAWPGGLPDSADGYSGLEQGLPFTRATTSPAFGRLLSKEIFSCPEACAVDAGGNLPETAIPLRREYVEYTAEAFLDESGNPTNQVPSARFQISAQQTEHADDTGCGANPCYTDTAYSNWDGYGHYGTAVTKSNFPGSHDRTTRKTYVHTQQNPPGSGGKWFLESYTHSSTEENGRISRGLAEFDATTGVLKSMTTLAGATPNELVDLKTVWCRKANTLEGQRGFITGERYVGGEIAPIPSDPCNVPLASDSGHYAIDHSYTFDGQNRLTSHKAGYQGMDFLTADEEFDPWTGLTIVSRDSAGFATSYEYDELGRLTELRPPGTAWTRYRYDRTSDPVRVHVDVWPAAASATDTPETDALKDDHYFYDGLGRLTLAKTRMPGSSSAWAAVKTVYDEAGRVGSVTVPVSVSSSAHQSSLSGLTTTYTYDEFDRVRIVEPPDETAVITAYTGARTKTTSFREKGAVTERARSTETYDGRGRLVNVKERSGPDGSEVTTTYAYDHADRLIAVETTSGGTAQNRSFEYDSRGWLEKETHPEQGHAGNGSITYEQFDARGHARRKKVAPDGNAIVTTFKFDRAERLTELADLQGVLKKFEFREDGLTDTDGKLWRATRYNRLTSGTFLVDDTYTYGGPGGRVSRRETDVSRETASGGSSLINRFSQSFDYDPHFGLPETIHYPAPSISPESTSGGLASVSQTYDRGVLDQIEGFATFTYHVNGMLHKVQRTAPGWAADVYEADRGMPRPASITFGYCPIRITAQPADKSVAGGAEARLEVTASGATSFQWYDAVAGTPIVGATTNTLFVDPSVPGPRKFFVRMGNGTCTVDSRTATVSLQEQGCGVMTAPPSNQTIPSGQTATFTVSVANGATVQWYEGSAPNTSIPVGTGVNFTTPVLTATKYYWCRVTKGDSSCYDDSPTVTANVISCESPAQVEIQGPASVVDDTPFQLTASTITGATYRWYKGTYDQATLLETTTVPAHAAAGITVPAQYFVEVQDATCNRTIRSPLLTVSVCSKPDQREIKIGTSGNDHAVLSVDALPSDGANVAFQWYQGSNYEDLSTPLGTTLSITVELGAPTSYWVKMTRTCGAVTAETRSAFVTVDAACAPKIFVQPVSSSVSMPVDDPATPEVPPPAVVSASVIAGPKGPFAYQWYFEDGQTIPGATGPTYTWSYNVQAASPFMVQRRVYVIVKATDCGATVTSDIVTLTISNDPQRIFVYQDDITRYYASQTADLFVIMAPEGPGHIYQYEWFRDDGTAGGKLLGSTASAITVQPTSVDSYWARISGTHTIGPDANGNYSEYVEQTVSPKMRVSVYPACDLPPMRVTQSHGKIAAAGDAVVRFQAVLDWPGTEFQWYEGLSGDTRVPIDGDDGAPDQLTVNDTFTKPYWVRAKLDCGFYRDSETLYVARDTCIPVVFDQNIPSMEVAYGGDARLTVVPPNIANATFTWIQELQATGDVTVSAPNAASLDLTHVTRSGRYRVRVRDNTCSTATESFPATVRVATCSSLTPPVWQTEVWTDMIDAVENGLPVRRGAPVTLSAQTVGATSYTWYKGELGDERSVVGTGSLYTTNALAGEAKYWVRASNATCSIDSPTITIKICDPPHVKAGHSLDLARNIVQGQFVRLSVPMEGTDLRYQWFQGIAPDTTRPIGRAVDMLEVHPLETGEYWARVTSLCGAGGSSPRMWDSPPFVVSICPILPAAPTTTKSIVMPGTSTTLSISANGTRLTYQWYSGQPGISSVAIPNSNSPSISVSPTATTTYWCEVSSGNCSRDSEPVTVNVCSIPTITISGREQVEKNFFQVLSLNGGPTDQVREFRWYVGDRGNTSSPYATTAHPAVDVSPGQTTKYWARVTYVETGCQADSNTYEVEVCIPKITAQPQPVMIDSGAQATLTVGVDLPNMAYQWYEGASGDKSKPVAGQTTATLTVSPSANTSYWARVSGCEPYATNSAAALVTICEPPAITRQPTGTNVPANASTAFSVGATGTNLTYQWYQGVSGNTTAPLAGKTSAELTVSIGETTDYWVRVSGSCGTPVNSNTVKISIPPAITTQPAGGGVVMSGTVRTLTVAATGTQLRYEWHKKVGTTDSVITGATTPSYTTPGLTVDTTYYCRVYSGNNYRDSSSVVFTICQLPTLTWDPVATEVTSGYFQVLSVSGVPAGTLRTHQWYQGNSGSTATPLGSQATLGISPSVTTSYWVRVTMSETGCWVDSTTKTVKVCKPTITTQPAASTTIDKIANPSAYATLSVAADITPVTYQWYIGQPGTTTSPIAGATGSTYNASPSSDTTYWVRVTGSCGYSQNSTAATVYVCRPPAITQHPSSVERPAGFVSELGVTATGTELTYRWYRGVTGVTTNPLGTSTTANVSPSVTTDYWVRVTGRCGTADSNTAKISVAPAITTQPVGGPITKGTTRTLTVAASGAQLTYQWYQRTTTATAISGATGPSYTTPPINTDATYFCRVSSGTARTDSVDAVLTVCQPQAIGFSGGGKVSGAEVTLQVSAPVANETYEWYAGPSGNVSTPLGSGTTKRVYPAGTSQYWMRTKRTGCDADSGTLTVPICFAKITAQPQGGLVTSGTQKTLSVTATGTAPLTYQWYIGAAGVVTNPISGATGATYTIAAVSGSTSYWVRITSPATGCSSRTVDSQAAVVSACNPPSISGQPVSAKLTDTQTVTLQVTASGDGLQYQWYQGAAGVTTTPVGTNSSTFTVKPVTTKSFWVRVTGSCGTVDSAAALLSVYPKIQSQPQPATVCQNSSATFSIYATGVETYTWYRIYPSQQPQVVGSTPTVSVPITQAGAQVWCELRSGNAVKMSNTVDVTVNPAPSVTSLTYSQFNATMYKLQANVAYADKPLVAYRFYEGQLGDTSKQVASTSYSYTYVTPGTLPKTYWVRVYYMDGGCATDKAVTIQ